MPLLPLLLLAFAAYAASMIYADAFRHCLRGAALRSADFFHAALAKRMRCYYMPVCRALIFHGFRRAASA